MITKRIQESLSLTSESCIEGNILRNVKILGMDSKNDRGYIQEAVQQAIPLYESRGVYFNHRLPPAGGFKPGMTLPARPFQDKFGMMRSVRKDVDGGLRGDLHFNPKHELCEQFLGWVENDPSAIGFSHAILAKTKRDDKTGREMVYEITKVDSIDIVTEAATTKGIFEAYEMETDEMMNAPEPGAEGYAVKIGELVQAIMVDSTLDVAAKRAKILGVLKLMDDAKPVEKKEEGEEEKVEDKKDEEKLEALFAKMEEKLGKSITEAVETKINQALKITESKKPASLPPAANKNGAVSMDVFMNYLKGGK
jgi:hypothetical protein